MSKARGKSIDSMYLGKEPSFDTNGSLEGVDRKMAIIQCVNYYNYMFKCKDNVKVCQAWASANMSKDAAKQLKSAPAVYHSNSFTSLIRMAKRGWVLSTSEKKSIKDGINKAISKAPKNAIVKPTTKVVAINPQQHLMNKINATIITDLDNFEDEWIKKVNGSKYDVFKKASEYGLNGSKIKEPVTEWINVRMLELQLAVSKKAEDAEFVEAYAHIKTSAIKSRIKVLKEVLSDLESLALSAKSTRKSRKPRVISSEKQVSKVVYKATDTEYKVSSINPVDIIGAHFLVAFNTSNRTATHYTTSRVEGFQIKGSTLQHFDVKESQSNRLRNADEFLKICLKKTPKQIAKAWKALTTKAAVPTGRFNKHTILLRVK